MEIRMDFLNCLDHDTSMKILRCLEDPSDLVRASYVSRSWRDFVIANGLCKQLCLSMFPHLLRVDCVLEPSCVMEKASEVGCSKFVEWETLKREHKAYAFLAQACLSFPFDDCIKDAISASSTDNYPEESIRNTLQKGDRVGRRPSYWSSKGQRKAAVPETLVYKLVADICVITEINIQPFQAYFQQGSPIYSAQSVRFHLGHPKCPMDDTLGEPLDNCADDKFIWTYSSPEFPMAQESRLQNFKLPEPVVCIGGILQIELLRRVQRQEMDGLFYICVAHVQVKGRQRIRREGKKEMQSLSPLRSALGSISASLPRGTFSSISRHAASPGCLERLGGSFWSIHNVAKGENARHASCYSGNFGTSFGLLTSKEDATVPYALSFQSFIHSTSHKDFETGRDSNPKDFAAGREDFELERSSMQNSNLEMERNPRSMNFSAGRRDFEMGRSSMQNSNLEIGRNPRSMNFSAGQRDFEMERGPRPDFYAGGRNSRPMDFVRGVIGQEGSRFPQYHVELNDDFVFMKLKRNNTFVAVTDSKGNKKKNASMTAGWLQKLQGGAKLSRYAAEATAEHVGQAARQLGLKSFVMRVNGFTYFKKKRLAITSFAEGYGKGGLSPIKHIEDNTRRPHNGCRLPRKRRI